MQRTSIETQKNPINADSLLVTSSLETQQNHVKLSHLLRTCFET